MVEEGVTTTETATTTETTEAPTMFDAEGNFSENWTHLLADAALHDDPTLKTIKSIDALAGINVSQRKMIGGNTALVPNEASSEAEWDVWHKAGGRPETAADYNFTRSEELPEENYSQDYVNGLQDVLFTYGANKNLAEALIKYDTEFKVKHLATTAQDEELAMTELQDGLHADWGNAYEQMKHDGNVAINNGAKGETPEFKARVVEKYGSDPDLTRLLANLGKVYREAGIITATSIPTTSDTQGEIDNITASNVYGTDYIKHGFTRAQHDTAVHKALALRERMDKSVKTG